MFERYLLQNLIVWQNSKTRKPLILRGARQVGKTTLVKLFSKRFTYFINLNLELSKDYEIFENSDDVKKILKILYLRENIIVKKEDSVLLFIDEIQNSSKAIKLLRYFYEEASEIFVIAAGSLLESIIHNRISFPVGRVEYLILRPFNFEEYLLAAGENSSLKLLKTIPFPDYGHSKLQDLFNEYCLIGGMPEIVTSYLSTRDIVKVSKIFKNLLSTYIDDIEKYAVKDNERKILRHVIESSLILAGERIKFEGFGFSNYKSKEISSAFKTLEKTLLLSLTYPFTGSTFPLIENKRKSPRLQLLDTGIFNFFCGIQSQILSSKFIDDLHRGKVAEHVVGQELLSQITEPDTTLYFWVKEKKQSNAEIDYIIPFKQYLIPIEVKLGKTGRLRSLMEYIDMCPHHYAIRIYSGEFRIEKLKTISGKSFTLLNLPFYLVGKINNYLEVLIQQKQ